MSNKKDTKSGSV